MKYKVGDEVRVKRTNKETMYKHIEGTTVLILNNVCNDLYQVIDYVGGQWILDEEMLEPADSKTLRMADGTIIGDFGLPTATETKEQIERVMREFQVNWGKPVIPKEEKKMPTKFTFYVTEGYRIDKSNNTRIPTMTTEVLINGKDYQYGGSATCDKTDYSEREGVLNAIANAVCGGNFDTVAEKEAHEAWHVERRKARHERYLLRKRAKEIAFEEQAQKMAKEIIAENKKEAK